ncbi:hypothetical protein N7520_008442 [Penicillium odoratum]|uniref:uncharacterized protein n=1 Tax=Penicillium odoratum TaxID=1167516 RepID=UPI002548B8E3|nr:uncharacterized protein N7520_008442 [Penicillium odoratum]KAJ5761286.1 hypothetical protein N7520_008442 [Penicillium odoratum]
MHKALASAPYDTHKLTAITGPVVRVGPNELSFASPDAALDIFRTGRGFQKTDFYTVFLPDNIKDIFTEIREKVHAKKKRFAVPPYSLASVKQQTEQIERLTMDLISVMDSTAAKNQTASFDLGSWLHFLVIDVLAQFAFDKPFGFIKNGRDIDQFLEGVSQAQYESSILGQIPKIERLTRSNPIWNHIPFLPKSKLSLAPETAKSVLKEFQEGDSEKSKTSVCLLKSLLDALSRNPEDFGMQDVMAISMGAIAAGSDTTASTMHSFCWNVLAHPMVHEKLVAELLDASLSPMVQYDQAITLPYFQACLKETMRLQPALPFNMTRTVPDAGATVDGINLPGGTRVAVSAWVIHRDESVFGPNTSSFNPERWLEADFDRLKKMERCMFQTEPCQNLSATQHKSDHDWTQFGGGSHTCIGRHLALFELNKVLPQIFYRYEMDLVDPKKPLEHVTRLFYNQTGLHVTLKMRDI